MPWYEPQNSSIKDLDYFEKALGYNIEKMNESLKNQKEIHKNWNFGIPKIVI